jgi:hypothetical protein
MKAGKLPQAPMKQMPVLSTQNYLLQIYKKPVVVKYIDIFSKGCTKFAVLFF